jgi:hypothetical protein
MSTLGKSAVWWVEAEAVWEAVWEGEGGGMGGGGGVLAAARWCPDFLISWISLTMFCVCGRRGRGGGVGGNWVERGGGEVSVGV